MTRQDTSASVDEIDELLPQTQCKQCGYPGCRPYAQAIAAGSAPINQCPPGGNDVIRELAALMGIPFEPLNPKFGVTTQPAIAVIDEQTCIGCTLCIQACPVDAIIGAAKVMHTVVEDDCTGCELCIPACPVDCIGMREPRRSIGRQERRARAAAARRRFEFRSLRLQLENSGPISKGDAPVTRGFADTKRATIEKAIARARVRLRKSQR